MKTFRIVLAILAIIPLFMIMDSALLHPANYETGSLGELAFLAIGIPS